MPGDPPRERAGVKETLVFYARLVAFLAGLAAFGFAVFWLRRSL
jgi:hypothetical protein